MELQLQYLHFSPYQIVSTGQQDHGVIQHLLAKGLLQLCRHSTLHLATQKKQKLELALFDSLLTRESPSNRVQDCNKL